MIDRDYAEAHDPSISIVVRGERIPHNKVQGTVIKTVFRTSKQELQQERIKALAANKPCGRIREVNGGWCYNEWHSGPKVNLN